MITKNTNIKSPCNDKCKYDEDKLCMGCHRTMNEIVNWPDFTDEEKINILKRVERKMKLTYERD